MPSQSPQHDSASTAPVGLLSLGISDDLGRVIKASRECKAIRVCLLSTRDRDYAHSLIKQVAVDHAVSLYHFTVAGRRRYNPDQYKWDEIGSEADNHTLLREASELRAGGVVIFEDGLAHLRDENGDPRCRMLLAQMLSSETSSDGLVLVFVEPPESARHVPSMLADQFVQMEAPYPRKDELERIAREELVKFAHRAGVPIDIGKAKTDAGKLAEGLVGLPRSAARDAVRDALVADPSNQAEAYVRLNRRKEAQLTRELAMNTLSTDGVEEPIGLDNLVEYLHVQKDRMRAWGAGRARGVLLIGPPGTGKTILARTIGRIVELPVVEFRIGSLMNSLLGETERRFLQAFQTLAAMAPNVVFIDEIEKAFGDSSERDGGTMMRCTGSLLSWLSDNPSPNFVVATSNNLRRMGEVGLAMTRSERFDAAFFVDVPTAASRTAMLERWLSPHVSQAQAMASELSAMTDKFSGADLRSVVKQAVSAATHAGTELGMDQLKAQIERKRLRAIALYDDFQELRRWGRKFCEPAGASE